MKSLLMCAMLASLLPAQLPVTLSYVLLGDVHTQITDPNCEGCTHQPVQRKDADSGEWEDLPVVQGLQRVSPSLLSGLMSWNVAASETNPSGFGLTLEMITFTPSNGDCKWQDSSQKCVNGKSCSTKVTLFFTAYANGTQLEGDGATIYFDIPIVGVKSIKVAPTGDVDPNTGLKYYSGSLSYTITPGCGRSTEFTLDATSMDPENVWFDYQWQTDGEQIELKMTCAVCPEDPVQ